MNFRAHSRRTGDAPELSRESFLFLGRLARALLRVYEQR
jgi:hypothetical protein